MSVEGGGEASGAVQVARSVCRRAERRVVPLVRARDADPAVLKYLNRYTLLQPSEAPLRSTLRGQGSAISSSCSGVGQLRWRVWRSWRTRNPCPHTSCLPKSDRVHSGTEILGIYLKRMINIFEKKRDKLSETRFKM